MFLKKILPLVLWTYGSAIAILRTMKLFLPLVLKHLKSFEGGIFYNKKNVVYYSLAYFKKWIMIPNSFAEFLFGCIQYWEPRMEFLFFYNLNIKKIIIETVFPINEQVVGKNVSTFFFSFNILKNKKEILPIIIWWCDIAISIFGTNKIAPSSHTIVFWEFWRCKFFFLVKNVCAIISNN